MRDDINKRLCELLGITGYDDWIDLLKRLKEKGCVYEFLARFAFPADFVSFLLNDTGALARVALEFLEASHESK